MGTMPVFLCVITISSFEGSFKNPVLDVVIMVYSVFPVLPLLRFSLPINYLVPTNLDLALLYEGM